MVYEILNMPQLSPFFFTNQTFIVFICITYLVYLLCKYLMPEPFRKATTHNLFL